MYFRYEALPLKRVYFSDDTETQETYESIKCPHKVKNTPWIAYRNSCYTFVIPQNRWAGLKTDEANGFCRKMSKLFLFKVLIFLCSNTFMKNIFGLEAP